MPPTHMLWCDSRRVKFRVSRSAEGYVVERLRKTRIRQDDPYSDYVWFTYAFLPERTYYLPAPRYRCDPTSCAQAHYLGHCQHEALVDTLHAAWSQLRARYERQVRNRLYRLVAQLRVVQRRLLAWQTLLPRLVPESRLICGTYVLFLPEFLGRFRLQQLLTILQAIRYPVTPQALEDLEQLVQDACTFNAAQHAKRQRPPAPVPPVAPQDAASLPSQEQGVPNHVLAG